jgi:glycosylphosphatidylinositol transamidase (GPIT) subunit GPI8
MVCRVALLLSLVLGIAAVSIGVDDPEDTGKHWVVIVAGSNGWYNYRHQVRTHLFFSLAMLAFYRLSTVMDIGSRKDWVLFSLCSSSWSQTQDPPASAS